MRAAGPFSGIARSVAARRMSRTSEHSNNLRFRAPPKCRDVGRSAGFCMPSRGFLEGEDLNMARELLSVLR
ncbi:hypothetical protein Bpla01_46970 [Burkholderia plantarii]|uniref:Uncharacterized protein n=1 Tax=Burkholderia plantarii TaxID=41899 RepID=A0A0B6S0F0_BURPL|nr:hypothetical protein BGL_1c33650 [Burkholderia plantarii]GLZ21168.1 hypothetical protein Bpla01_46970 [Burkholderia plantarii]